MTILYDSARPVKTKRFALGLTRPAAPYEPSAEDRQWLCESAEAEHDRWLQHLEDEARYADEMRRVCGEARRYGAFGGHMVEGAI